MLRAGDRLDFVHEPAENAPLAAAGGDRAPRGSLLEPLDARAGFHRGGADFPIHGDGLDLIDRSHEALVAQVAQHQPLGPRAQRHQRDELALVHIQRERPLGRDRRGAELAVFVDGGDLARQRCAGFSE